jgi:hypothetical protein
MNDSKESAGAFEANQWKPGQSGNPKGGKKGSTWGLRARINAVLRKHPTQEIMDVLKAKGVVLDDPDNAGVIAEVVNRKAQQGDMSAIKFLGDLTEAKLPHDLNLGGELTINKIERVIVDPKDQHSEDI